MHLSRLPILGATFVVLFGSFVVLFGDPSGLFGSLTPALDPTVKSKIVNALAVFGLSCLAIAVWLLVYKDGQLAFAVVPMAFAFWLSLSYGFLTVDCRIFTFCGRDEATSTRDCTTEYDRQGAHVDCK